jgi:enediyne biosynthesis protein E4
MSVVMRFGAVRLALLLAVFAAGAQSVSQRASDHRPTPYPVDKKYPPPAWFVNVAERAGLTMHNYNGEAAAKNYILETTGGGAAILDYDRDGWPDIFLTGGRTLDGEPAPPNAPTSHLYHNNHDGTFTDVTVEAGLAAAGWAQGACVGDYDNDGYDDLYVTYYGKNLLYHNERNGRFREVAQETGVAGDGTKWGTGCAFIDYDRDGKLDLFVANYVQFDLKTAPKPGERMNCIWKGMPVECGPRGLAFTTNLLYHNIGGGKFADVTKASGITATNGHYCLGVAPLDYNRDGWPDIYVACDSTPSILYRNNKDGTFSDVAVDGSVAFSDDGNEQAGMGAAVGDYDGDGWQDIFKTNFSDDTSSLYRNNRDGTFTPSIVDAGLSLNTHYLGWGAMFVDVDNDGWPDLLLANGHVYPQVDTDPGISYREPRLLYWNQGNGRFKDISATSGPGCTEPIPSRGLAVADLWNDGRESAVVNDMDEKPLLLVNLAANPNHWLGVALEGTNSNRDGIGARVSVTAAGRTWVQELRSGASYLSSSDLRLHFGLGAASTIDHIDVLWPSGADERFPSGPVNRFVTLREASGTPLHESESQKTH